jgi:excisionase family DNA binding protein
MMKKLYTVAETAEMLGVCAKTVRNKIRSGELGHVRIGRAIRIKLEHIDEYIDAVEQRRTAHVDDSSVPQNVPHRGLQPHQVEFRPIPPRSRKTQSV